MELFKLMGTIAVDSTAAESALTNLSRRLGSAGSSMGASLSGITGSFSSMSGGVGGILASLAGTAGGQFGSLRQSLVSSAQGIASGVAGHFNSLSGSISANLATAYSAASGRFGAIASAASGSMGSALSAVSNAVSAMRAKFNFSWSLPHLKLPHVSIRGSFSLNPPSVPSFSVSWYKKAMENAMLLDRPTIFGMGGGTLLGGGEAGQEVVAGSRLLRSMIGETVAAEISAQLAPLTSAAEEIAALLSESLPKLENQTLTLDTGVVAGALAPKLDTELYKRSMREGRRI